MNKPFRIITLENYKKRTLAIAKGEVVPKKNDPKLWFGSLRAFWAYWKRWNEPL